MKIGDKVEVVDNGETFDTYENGFVNLGFKNKTENPLFDNGTIATIFAIGEHEYDSYGQIYGIEDKYGNQSLIGNNGIKITPSRTYYVTPTESKLIASIATRVESLTQINFIEAVMLITSIHCNVAKLDLKKLSKAEDGKMYAEILALQDGFDFDSMKLSYTPKYALK